MGKQGRDIPQGTAGVGWGRGSLLPVRDPGPLPSRSDWQARRHHGQFYPEHLEGPCSFGPQKAPLLTGCAFVLQRWVRRNFGYDIWLLERWQQRVMGTFCFRKNWLKQL